MRVLLVAATNLSFDDNFDFQVPGYQEHGYDGGPGVRNADELAEMAGRLCYESWDRPNPKTATNEGYLGNIIQQGHFSVLEHASATFYIDGVSRNFSHELIRHRHLSFSEVSQRYVDISTFNYVAHPTLEKEYGDRTAVSDGIADSYSGEQYVEVVDDLVERGYTRKEARQAARFYIPSACETKILVTGNHRAWREMLPKRLSKGADLEFQLVARDILKLLKEIAPNTYQDIEVPE